MSETPWNLPRWSLRNPTLVVLLTVAFAAWGILSYGTMSRREDPEIKIATALVITIYPGAGAEQVEEQVTRRLEDAIESLDTIDRIESTTRANISVIFVTVRYDVDTDVEWQKLRSRVAEARAGLPASVIGPDVMDNFGDTTGMLISLGGADMRELGELADDLKAELRRVQSVGTIEIHGKQAEAVYLEGRRADMASYGLTPYGMAQLLGLRNLRLPAGAIRTDRYQYRLEPSGAFRSVEPIAGAIIDVGRTDGSVVHVRDLFEVRREAVNPPHSEVLREGEPCVALGLVMKRGHNIVAMGKEVREVLGRFAGRLPPAVKMEVVHDSPRQVNGQISRFTSSLLQGVGIVIVVMTLLMGLRAATISAVAIPLSVLVTLALMPALSIDLEMVSIASFIVALGMLVDNSIIIADNVDIKLREGLGPQEAAWRGAHELAGPVVVGTMATAVAFLPMLLVTKEMGAYVRSLPLVVTVSLAVSLVLAMTVTPLLSRAVMRRPRGGGRPVGAGRVARGYRVFIGWCLRWRPAVVLVAAGSLVAAALLLGAVGFSFFPDADRDQFTVEIWLKEGSAVAETGRVARRAEELMLADEQVVSTLVHVGRGGPRFYITVMPEFQKSNYAQIMVNTASADVTHDVIERFNTAAAERFPGARVFAKKLVMGMPIEAPVAFRVIGGDLGELHRISERLQEILRGTPGTRQVRDSVGPKMPSLEVEVHEERANRVGITNTDVALALLATYEGFELTRFSDGGDDLPVILRLLDEERAIDQDPTSIPVSSSVTGRKVPLGSIATLRPVWGAGVIKRRDNQRTVSVLAWTDGRLADDIVREVWPRVEALDLPDGYRVEIAGEKEELDKAFFELLVVFGVIVVGLLLLLVYQLRTLRRTLVVLLSVPLAVVGAALGLFIGGFSFSFMAFLGVISLAGMAIKNSVVWVEFVERARERGAGVREAVIEAGIMRLRPIVLTAATTIGGLLPLALFGGILFEPMAWAMIAGLALVTVFTLVAIPVFYDLLMPKDPPGGRAGDQSA